MGTTHVSDPTPLHGRVAVVTGATRGIGRATTSQLSELGARVVGIARHPPGGRAGEPLETCLRADVRSFGSVVGAMEGVVSRFGGIDIVVANAGLGEQSSVLTGDHHRWWEVIETNLLGLAYTLRAALPHLADRHGHAVILASVAGLESYVGEPAYLASKWGAVGLGRALRREALAYGVRCTIVSPGLVETEMTHASPEVEAWLSRVDPLRPDDVAAAIVFALVQPRHVVLSEVTVRPTLQEV